MQIACKWQLTVFVSIGSKGKSRRVFWVHVWICLCKYLMYPSGTKESKYPARGERGGGSRQVRRLSSQQLNYYTPTPPGSAQERKNTDLKPENKSRATAPHSPKPRASCVRSSQLLHHLEPCLVHLLLRSLQSPHMHIARQSGQSQIKTRQMMFRKSRRALAERSNLCTGKPPKSMRQGKIIRSNA